jgi:hypothetical protein
MHFAVILSTVRLQQRRWLGDSSRGARDVEPLVNRRVDRGGGLVLVLGDAEGGSIGTVVAVGHGGVGAVSEVSRCPSFACDCLWQLTG